MNLLRTILVSGAVIVLLINEVDSARIPRKAGSFIVNGFETERYNRPYLVHLNNNATIRYKNGSHSPWFWTFHCGGAIIDAKWILTAAHCVPKDGWYASDLQVTASDHDLTRLSGQEQQREIKKIHRHRDYNRYTEENDIALLELKISLDLKHQGAAVIPLNTDAHCPQPGDACMIMGWGRTSDGGPSAAKPREALVPVVSNNECQENYNKSTSHYYPPTIFDSMICAGRGDRDSCQGDSGGPVVCSCDNKKVHAGLVSWGDVCADDRFPGVYTRTTSFLPWVECTMHGDKDC